MSDKHKSNLWLLLLIVFVVGILFFAVVIIVYAGHFYQNPISQKSAEWGQLGDFIGGILNPVFAFFNLLALVYLSFRIADWESQREEEKEEWQTNREKEQQAMQVNLSLVQYRVKVLEEFKDKVAPYCERHYSGEAISYSSARNEIYKIQGEIVDVYNNPFVVKACGYLLDSFSVPNKIEMSLSNKPKDIVGEVFQRHHIYQEIKETHQMYVHECFNALLSGMRRSLTSTDVDLANVIDLQIMEEYKSTIEEIIENK